MMGMSKVIVEWTKAWTPGLPAGLVRRSVDVEPLEKQEIHMLTEQWRIQALMKQDEIPRTDKPSSSKVYYLNDENNAGCMVEQRDG